MPQGKLTDKEREHLRDCLNDAICGNCESGLDWNPKVDLSEVEHGEEFQMTCANCGNDETVSTSLFFQKGWDA